MFACFREPDLQLMARKQCWLAVCIPSEQWPHLCHWLGLLLDFLFKGKQNVDILTNLMT